MRDGKPLKVTIDSTEPLADAIRVIGALYNVNLAQVSAATDDTTTVRVAQRRPTRPVAAKPSPRTPAKTVKTSSARTTGSSRRSETVSSSDVRAWAAANGHTVSNRGTLPGAIKAAYAEAHTR